LIEIQCAAALPAGDVALGASLAYGERGAVTVARVVKDAAGHTTSFVEEAEEEA
jgi:hypothetical protein